MRRTAAILLALAAALAAWALLIEPRRLVVRRRTLRLPRWPADLAGLRVALVSDLHAGAPHVGPGRVARVAGAVRREAPDLVLLLGDFVDPEVTGGGFVDPERVAGALAGLDAPLGVLAVLGNHDWTTDGPRVSAALRRRGITVLENDAVALGRGLWAAGVADASERRPRIDDALAPVPPEAPVLLLSHDPDVFPRVPDRVALTVSGHTHGGQVDVPGLRAKVVPSRFGERFARGHVVEDGRHLFVTSGIGTSRWPIRLRRPPEVVVLTLEVAKA